MGKSITKELLIVVLGAIIVAFLIGGGNVQGLADMFNTPDPVRIIQESGEFCPMQVYTDQEGQSGFKVELRNGGKEGTLYVNLSSEYFIARTNPRDPYLNSSVKAWRVPAGNYQDFDFSVKRTNQTAGNVSFRLEYGCPNLFCDKFCNKCQYQRSSSTLYQYEFIGESAC